MLQWGHADVGVEDRRRLGAVWAIQLQWGHADVGVEDIRGSRLGRRRPVASMGPRRCRRGRRRGDDPSGRDARASMGPRRCRRGRRPAALPAVRPMSRLQWGHADVGVEDPAVEVAPSPAASLQWGHADVGVEDDCAADISETASGLQWGHADVGVEDRTCRLSVTATADASMGPRRCRRGRRGLDGRARGRHGLQWGHADVGVEDRDRRCVTTARRQASMGPRRCRRGRPNCSAPIRSPSTSFNGATPMSAWKTVPSPAVELSRCQLQWGHADVGVEDRDRWRPTHGRPASMGPRRCRRGRRRDCAVDHGSRTASMGPRRCRRGRRSRAACVRPPRVLQWGHADVGVEDADRQMRAQPEAERFNGATPMSAWKTPTMPRWSTAGHRLQWGHADVGVEDEREWPWLADRAELQWGHADVGVEDDDAPRAAADASRLQWGHADVGVEDVRRGVELAVRPSSFNGATPMSAWKTTMDGAGCRRMTASMGPRRCRRGRRSAAG